MKQFNPNTKELSLKAVCRYDEDSARLLYQHFYAALVNFSAQITGDVGIAEDIVQEVFGKLWEKKIQFDHLAKLKAYLYNSVRNSTISFLRKKKDNIVDITKSELIAKEYIVDDDGKESPFTEEVYRQLFQLIDELPERQRQVFLLLMEGHTNDEISQMLTLSVETVRTHRKRAIHYLKEHLSEDAMMLLTILVPSLMQLVR